MNNTLISWEGVDGSGKTTLLKAVEQACRDGSIPVRATKEPSESRIGELILDDDASYPPETQTLLFAADRALHQSTPLYHGSRDECVVLCDRHVGSTLAYQGPQLADKWELPLDAVWQWIHEVHSWSGVRYPDVTVYVDTPPETAVTRLYDRDTYESDGMLDAAHDAYRRLYSAEDCEACHTVVTVDGSQPRDEMIDNGVPKVLDAIEDYDSV
jgi:dTMP kinase